MAQTSINISNITVRDTGVSWWDSNWGFRKKLVFNNSGSTEDLRDFPALVRLTPLNFNYSKARDDGADLRFVDDDNATLLNYEIELWNTSGDSFIWVNVTRIDAASSDDYIWIYYGNDDAATGENTAATWKSSYGIVYHMDPGGVDSTSNNRDRVSDEGDPSIDDTFIGHGLYFDGDDGWNQQDMGYWEQQWNVRTHEIMFETNLDIISRQTLFAEGDSNDGAMMYILNGVLYARWWSESNGWNGGHLSTSVSTNTRYYVAMCYTYPGNLEIYVNGASVNSTASVAGISSHSGDGGIAYTGNDGKDYHDGYYGPGSYFNGSIHEFRISDKVENASWINASYLSIVDRFINHGEEESRGDIYLNLTVKNTGDVTLETNRFTILVNGIKKPFTSNAWYIYPGNEAVFVVNVGNPGPKKIKMITGNGVSDHKMYVV